MRWCHPFFDLKNGNDKNSLVVSLVINIRIKVIFKCKTVPIFPDVQTWGHVNVDLEDILIVRTIRIINYVFKFDEKCFLNTACCVLTSKIYFVAAPRRATLRKTLWGYLKIKAGYINYNIKLFNNIKMIFQIKNTIYESNIEKGILQWNWFIGTKSFFGRLTYGISPL